MEFFADITDFADRILEQRESDGIELEPRISCLLSGLSFDNWLEEL
jgi:hypothetical protein